MINLENYRIVCLRDCYSDITYGAILLNNKHTTQEFQDEINRVKNLEQVQKNIAEYGDDWEYIKKEIDEKFDWSEDICLDIDDYVEY